MDEFCSEWELDKEAVPNAEVRVLQYIQADGEICYDVKHKGWVPLSQFIGLLELAKDAICEQFRESR